MLGKLSKNWDVSKVRVHCNFFNHAIACVQHMTSQYQSPTPSQSSNIVVMPLVSLSRASELAGDSVQLYVSDCYIKLKLICCSSFCMLGGHNGQ